MKSDRSTSHLVHNEEEEEEKEASQPMAQFFQFVLEGTCHCHLPAVTLNGWMQVIHHKDSNIDLAYEE